MARLPRTSDVPSDKNQDVEAPKENNSPSSFESFNDNPNNEGHVQHSNVPLSNLQQIPNLTETNPLVDVEEQRNLSRVPLSRETLSAWKKIGRFLLCAQVILFWIYLFYCLYGYCVVNNVQEPSLEELLLLVHQLHDMIETNSLVVHQQMEEIQLLRQKLEAREIADLQSQSSLQVYLFYTGGEFALSGFLCFILCTTKGISLRKIVQTISVNISLEKKSKNPRALLHPPQSGEIEQVCIRTTEISLLQPTENLSIEQLHQSIGTMVETLKETDSWTPNQAFGREFENPIRRLLGNLKQLPDRAAVFPKHILDSCVELHVSRYLQTVLWYYFGNFPDHYQQLQLCNEMVEMLYLSAFGKFVAIFPNKAALKSTPWNYAQFQEVVRHTVGEDGIDILVEKFKKTADQANFSSLYAGLRGFAKFLQLEVDESLHDKFLARIKNFSPHPLNA